MLRSIGARTGGRRRIQLTFISVVFRLKYTRFSLMVDKWFAAMNVQMDTTPPGNRRQGVNTEISHRFCQWARMRKKKGTGTMLETLLVILIAFIVFMLFWVIVLRAKQPKRRSPLHSCGACGQGCDCSTTDSGSYAASDANRSDSDDSGNSGTNE
jgi:cytoskeletal protein RodZ